MVTIKKKPCFQLPYVFLVEYLERNYWFVVVSYFLKYILIIWVFFFSFIKLAIVKVAVKVSCIFPGDV